MPMCIYMQTYMHVYMRICVSYSLLIGGKVTAVIVQSLVSRPKVNGVVGHVAGYDIESSRFGVELSGDECVFKDVNLIMEAKGSSNLLILGQALILTTGHPIPLSPTPPPCAPYTKPYIQVCTNTYVHQCM